jgi:NAD-dependent SIR2 family protein deacetylase
MTTISALIPRLRHRHGRIVSIRCAACRTWRKPRAFDRNSNTCHTCSYSAARKRLLHRITQRG